MAELDKRIEIKHTHHWISLKELEATGPSVCKGEYGPADGVLLMTPVNPTEQPAVCSSCYQIFGKADGTIFPGLIEFEKIQSNLENNI